MYLCLFIYCDHFTDFLCSWLLFPPPIISFSYLLPRCVHCLFVTYSFTIPLLLSHTFSSLLCSAASPQFVSLLFLLSVCMRPSVRFHSCVFLCAFLTSLPLDSVLKISHVTLSPCCPMAEGGFSPALLSFYFWKCCQSYGKRCWKAAETWGTEVMRKITCADLYCQFQSWRGQKMQTNMGPKLYMARCRLLTMTMKKKKRIVSSVHLCMGEMFRATLPV